MTNPNKAELRRLAGAASHKDWYAGNAFDKPFILKYQIITDTPDGKYVLLDGNQNFPDDCVANVAFVGAANPATVLSLLDECDKAESEKSALKHALDVKEEFYQDALHSHIVLAQQRDQARSEAEALKASLGTPDEITAEPAGDYESLLKQFMSLRSLANSECQQTRYWHSMWNRLSNQAMVNDADAERDTNAMLTDALMKAEQERDAALAELEALRQEKTDWQKECLKKGFEYVRESDDHYVVADPAEMVLLLRDLLGIDVRQKDGSDYGVSVAELEEQIEGLINTIHGLEACRKDAGRLDRLDMECEAYGFEGIHEGNRWMIDGPFRTVRDAIDATMSQEANHA